MKNIASNQKEAYSIFDKFYIDIINGNILGENENLQSVQEKTIFVFHLIHFSNNCKLWKIKKGSRVEYLPKFGSALNLFVLDELKILNYN